jgi:DNA-binding CsgD family transcriptional regulator
MTASHLALDSFSPEFLSKPSSRSPRNYQLQNRPPLFQNALADMAFSILDHLPIGIIFLGSDMYIHQANATARSVLNQRDGLLEQNQRLVTSTSNQTAALQKIVRRVLDEATCNVKSEPHKSAISVSRPSSRRPFELLATTFPRNNNEGIPRDICPVLFIFDPESEVRPMAEIIMQLYKLTAAEAKVAIMLMQGSTLQDISVTLGIVKETARKQLQSVFWKTNTNRQSELVLLLIRGTASLKL